VEDNGPGIDALDLPLIFEKFYRGKRAGARFRRKGSGMGLAITRAILTSARRRNRGVQRPRRRRAFNFASGCR
jgi:signal transduction histidine kinase